MKLTNLIQAREAIKCHMHDKVSYGTAYKFAKFIKATDTQDTFYHEQLKGLIDLCGLKDDNGKFIYRNNSLALQPERTQEWTTKLEELNDTEVDIPDVHFMPADFEEIKVTTEEMLALVEFIEEN